jgi:serine phosphatase RsbU (regulator of sigma subunit)/anti-sigma regulatory factor (Ser/Thr protein kinase)
MDNADDVRRVVGVGRSERPRVAALVRGYAWDRTPLGRRDAWDPLWAASVDLILSSDVAMALCHGDDEILLYNDSYAALLGASHPWAFGRAATDVFAKVWGTDTEPAALAGVRRTGVPFTEIGKPSPSADAESSTGTYLVHSYSAVRDSRGEVSAVLAVVTDSVQATASTRRLHDLRELTAALAHTVTLDDVARVTMHHAVAAFDVDQVALAIADGQGWRAVRQARGDAVDEADLRLPPLWHRFPADAPLPMIRAASSGHPIYLSDADLAEFRPYATDRHDRSLQALAALPLPTGRIRGSVVFAYQRPHRWSPEQRALLSAAVETIGQATARAALYDTQQDTAHLLQRSMLPHELPTLDNFRLAAQYHPGVDGNAAGGDFYDAFAVAGDRMAIVLGDVAGHDVRAAAFMGQIRAAVRAFAQIDPSPTMVLTNLDRLVDSLSDQSLSSQNSAEPTFVTMIYGLVDSRTHTVQLANAGHPEPLLRRSSVNGRPAFTTSVTLVPGPPLGLGLRAGADTGHPTVEMVLAPGDTLLMFSDGVIERRGLDLSDGVDALAAALTDAPTGDARTLAALLPQVIAAPTEDDIAVLAVERALSPSRHATYTVAPEPQAPGRARRWLRDLLQAWQVDDSVADTAALCLSELATNALLHAGTHAHVDVDLTDERLLVTVTDFGSRGTITRAEGPGLASRGRGLNLVESITDAWATEPVSHGTRVWFELLLNRPTVTPSSSGGSSR